ncbi:IS66 family insertion sequence element accessory protein TnpA [Allohahella sp. A8]|uniref:IS66 family insertion sequence element accessory protein TnpA n=1 Tax=Allohahella sp. A8 TaxID=3141461 RepID=UPI003A803706
MSRGAHRSPAQWRSILQEHDASSLSTSEFCKRHKVSSQSLYRWRKLLEAESVPAQPMFAPIQPAMEPLPADQSTDGHCHLRINLGRWLSFELAVPLT